MNIWDNALLLHRNLNIDRDLTKHFNTMKESKLKPFDLSRALAGDKVITRDGREVKELKTFNVEYKPLIVLIGNTLYAFTLDGKYSDRGNEGNSDLFMAPKMTKYYVHVYNYRTDQIAMFTTTPTLLAFDQFKILNLNHDVRLIKTFEFEIEE